MSDVNLDFTVSNSTIGLTVEPNDISFTPSDIQLSFYALGASQPGGSNGTVQFNSGGILGGSTDFTFDGPNATVNMSKANITLLTISNVANFRLAGGNSGEYLRTDGSGNLSWSGTGASPGGPNLSLQFNNNTSFGGSANLTFNSSTNTLNVTGNVSANNFNGNISATNVIGSVANATYANAAANINSITYGIENISIISAQTGTYNFDILDNSIKFSTSNAAANLILNFRGNSTTNIDTILGNSKSVTATYILSTGATSYSITGVQIDGSTQSINWAQGSVPISGPNSKNSYTFTLIKTSTTPTYNVFGSMTRYG